MQKIVKKISWKVAITDLGENLISYESSEGFQNDSIETEVMIIGILESLKNKHMKKLTSIYSKSGSGTSKIKDLKSKRIKELGEDEEEDSEDSEECEEGEED